MTVKYDTALVCEDVRREDNGKLILIGVYGANIQAPYFPVTLPISFVLIASTNNTNELWSHFRMFHDEEHIFSSHVAVRPSHAGRLVIPTGITHVPFKKAGKLRGEVCATGKDWDKVPVKGWKPLLEILVEGSAASLPSRSG